MKSKHCTEIAILLTVLIMAASAAATPDVQLETSPEISIDDAVVKFLGRQRIKVIFTADTVETYQIDWRRRSDQKTKYSHGYQVISKGRDLEALEIRIFRALVAQETSYDFLVSKRTRLRPAYMLRFIKNAAVVDIVLDLQSNQWGFYFKDFLVQEDITESLTRPVLMMIFKAVFGIDQGIKAVKF